MALPGAGRVCGLGVEHRRNRDAAVRHSLTCGICMAKCTRRFLNQYTAGLVCHRFTRSSVRTWRVRQHRRERNTREQGGHNAADSFCWRQRRTRRADRRHNAARRAGGAIYKCTISYMAQPLRLPYYLPKDGTLPAGDRRVPLYTLLEQLPLTRDTMPLTTHTISCSGNRLASLIRARDSPA